MNAHPLANYYASYDIVYNIYYLYIFIYGDSVDANSSYTFLSICVMTLLIDLQTVLFPIVEMHNTLYRDLTNLKLSLWHANLRSLASLHQDVWLSHPRPLLIFGRFKLALPKKLHLSELAYYHDDCHVSCRLFEMEHIYLG